MRARRSGRYRALARRFFPTGIHESAPQIRPADMADTLAPSGWTKKRSAALKAAVGKAVRINS